MVVTHSFDGDSPADFIYALKDLIDLGVNAKGFGVVAEKCYPMVVKKEKRVFELSFRFTKGEEISMETIEKNVNFYPREGTILPKKGLDYEEFYIQYDGQEFLDKTKPE